MSTLREDIVIQLKIIEHLSGNNDKNMTNDFPISSSNWHIAHSSYSSNKRQRRSKNIHSETSNTLAPLLTENPDDITKCSSINIALGNSKKSHLIKLMSHFDKKRRPDVCVTENSIKNFTPVTIPGNSNYASVPKKSKNLRSVAKRTCFYE